MSQSRLCKNRTREIAQAELLKLMGTPEDLLHHLLDTVAKIFPPDGDFLEPGPFPRFPCLVRVSCPCLESHALSPTGFLLLEEIESVLGTTEQKVEEVTIETLEGPLLAALSSRLSRQEGLATSIHSISAAASLDEKLAHGNDVAPSNLPKIRRCHSIKKTNGSCGITPSLSNHSNSQ